MWSCLIKKPISKIIKAWKIDRSTASFWWTSQCAQKSAEKSLKEHVVQIVIRLLLWAIKWLQRDLRETIHIRITFNYRNKKSKLSKSVLTTEAIPTRSHHGCTPILPNQGSTTPVQFWASGSTNARGTLGHGPKDESTTWWMNPRSSGKGNGCWITPMMPFLKYDDSLWKKPINSSMTSVATHRKSSYFRFHVPPGWTFNMFNCKGLPIPKAPRYDNQWSSVSPAFLITASWREPWIHVGNWMLGRHPGIVEANKNGILVSFPIYAHFTNCESFSTALHQKYLVYRTLNIIASIVIVNLCLSLLLIRKVVP